MFRNSTCDPKCDIWLPKKRKNVIPTLCVVVVRNILNCIEESRMFGIVQYELLNHSISYSEEDLLDFFHFPKTLKGPKRLKPGSLFLFWVLVQPGTESSDPFLTNVFL